MARTKQKIELKAKSNKLYLWGGIVFACLMAGAGGVYFVLQSQAAGYPFYVNHDVYSKNASGQYVGYGARSYSPGQVEAVYPYLAVNKNPNYNGEQLVYAFTYDASRVELLSSACQAPWTCFQSSFSGPLMHPNGSTALSGVHSSRAVYCFDSFPASPSYYPVKITVKFKTAVSDIYWFAAWHGFAPNGCTTNRSASQAVWVGGRSGCGASHYNQNGSYSYTEPACYAGPNPGAGSFIGFSGGPAPAAGGGNGAAPTGASPITQPGGGGGQAISPGGGGGQAISPGSGGGGSSSRQQQPRPSSIKVADQPNTVPENSAVGTAQELPKMEPSPFYDGKEYARGSDDDRSFIGGITNNREFSLSRNILLLIGALVLASLALIVVFRKRHRNH